MSTPAAVSPSYARMAQAARHLIPVELEPGGKDPMIVFEDADLEHAAAAAVWGALTNSGQSCTSIERIYVQESVYDRFKDLVLRSPDGFARQPTGARTATSAA